MFRHSGTVVNTRERTFQIFLPQHKPPAGSTGALEFQGAGHTAARPGHTIKPSLQESQTPLTWTVLFQINAQWEGWVPAFKGNMEGRLQRKARKQTGLVRKINF